MEGDVVKGRDGEKLKRIVCRVGASVHLIRLLYLLCRAYDDTGDEYDNAVCRVGDVFFCCEEKNVLSLSLSLIICILLFFDSSPGC